MNVVVVATARDIQADTLARAIANRADMVLVSGKVLTLEGADALLASGVLTERCALVLVGPDADTQEPAERYLREFPNVVVMCLAAPRGDLVRLGARHHAGLEELFTALRALVDGAPAAGRIARSVMHGHDAVLIEAKEWIHSVFLAAIARLPKGNGELFGLSTTPEALLANLESVSGVPTTPGDPLRAVFDSDADTTGPLTALQRVFDLDPIELRLFLLALAPELDARYQRCVGVLLDDLGRRVGTLGLYSALLGDPTAVRIEVGALSRLSRWRVFESGAALPAADEPCRVDAALVSWILGDRDALTRDPLAHRVIRVMPWPGASLLGDEADRSRAERLIESLHASDDVPFTVLAGNEAAAWRALIEAGSARHYRSLIRVDAQRVAKLDPAEAEECGVRLGRASLLSNSPLAIDVAGAPPSAELDAALGTLFAALWATGCRAVVIGEDSARIARLLGSIPFMLQDTAPLAPAARAAAFERAARVAGVALDHDTAGNLVSLYPLQIDGLEQAAAVAAGRRGESWTPAETLDSFIAACKQATADGSSNLAERLEPRFSLDDVVLPGDRKQQLEEIVDNIRFASRVLDDWRFGAQLPYGRGVSALLYGPSGTGKTMAAMAVARKLGVQVLRVDLSRIVSKYIGDTEKNIERVFEDARRSGAALLIDEAEALLGKRSEVKDAHDRYANIEVAYLLQRMEAYEGLAILTTNLLQNVDAAFLRRLRFIIEFPRPDAAAREIIWRQCLPPQSHNLDAATFRLLGRKVDLTGGHIRQITLRAAFVAAAQASQIGLPHIVYATNAELAKVGQQPMNFDEAASRRVA
jgi:AAA+ superfamily predicted ATPase